jgi:hypothetical protein
MQNSISREKIEQMIEWEPRRFRLQDSENPLKAPHEMGPRQVDWNLIFPFWETFGPAFYEMCPMVDHIPFQTRGKAYFTFLKNVTNEDIEQVKFFYRQ